MIGIYKITNNINGKCYIGQTIDSDKRWKEHKQYSKYKSNGNKYVYPLANAMRKYGIENFSFEMLEELPNDKDLLYEKEKYYYNIYQPKYNQVIPEKAEGNQITMRSVCQIDINTLKVLNRYDSVSEAARSLGLGRKNISCTLSNTKRNITAGGYYWCYEKDLTSFVPPKRRVVENHPHKVKVAKIDPITNEVLTIYESQTVAAKENNITREGISSVCNGRYQTAGGYIWRKIYE